MHKHIGTLAVLTAAVCLFGFAGWSQDGPIVYFVREGEAIPIRLADYAEVSGIVAYQGPLMDGGGENWKRTHAYAGVSILSMVEALGGLADGETLGVVAIDGWHKILPRSVVYEETSAGVAILATSIDDTAEWDDAPMLVFLPGDERFSNDDMIGSFGADRAHYFGAAPSTTGMMVKGVVYLVVNYGGEPLPLPSEPSTEKASAPEDVLLTLVKGDATFDYTLRDLEALEVITGRGTFTNSAGVDFSATYTGVPLSTLVGNVTPDSTVRVTASDGYSMNYEAGMLLDHTEGTWILAYRENGEYMPLDPGYLRIVQVGEKNPHFTSSLSAKMVRTIEVLGIYEEYSLLLTGAVERLFARGELEAGIGCPCHTATIHATSKGETHTYTGLPLWRLIGYVDDDLFPATELGIHYNDVDFSDALAATAYSITLVASDGYTQTVASDLIARDDRFVVAFKLDGAFLDPAVDGYMRFVFDDTVELSEGSSLRSVKSLVQIRLDL